MKSEKILVTAANGHTGLPVAKELLNLGFNVRAMVRNPNGKGALELKEMGAEIFIGDMEDVRDYREVLKGVQRAYFCAPVKKNTLFKTIAFITAAEEAKLEHVVYMSQWLLSEDHYAINTKEQWLGDQVVKMHKNVNYTFVNPGMFSFTYFFTAEVTAQLGLMPVAITGAASGDAGLNAPPSEDDQGRVIAHILKDPAKHIGKTYRPTGPRIISYKDVAQIFGKILGKKVKIMEVSESMLLKALRSYGYDMYECENMRYYVRDVGQNAFVVGGGVTSVVKDITGREPEDFETIARRQFAGMPEAEQSVGNKLKAIRNFIRMLLIPTPDMATYERQQSFPQFKHGLKHSKENADWLKIHESQTNAVEEGHQESIKETSRV